MSTYNHEVAFLHYNVRRVEHTATEPTYNHLSKAYFSFRKRRKETHARRLQGLGGLERPSFEHSRRITGVLSWIRDYVWQESEEGRLLTLDKYSQRTRLHPN